MVATSIYRLTQLGKLHLSRLICSVWIESAGPIYRSLIKMVIFTFENHVQTLVHVVSFSFLLSWLGNGDSYNLICGRWSPPHVMKNQVLFLFREMLGFLDSEPGPPSLYIYIHTRINIYKWCIYKNWGHFLFDLEEIIWYIYILSARYQYTVKDT
jgi:hypothetical protein